MRALRAFHGDVAYNLVFHTAPHHYSGAYHWHIHLFPKMVTTAGFERGTGVMINIVPLFMFATPVFYHQSMFSAPWDIVIYANALTGYVEVMRDVMLVGKLPNWYVYLWTLFTSVSTFYFGYWFFDRYRNVIVDVI